MNDNRYCKRKIFHFCVDLIVAKFANWSKSHKSHKIAQIKNASIGTLKFLESLNENATKFVFVNLIAKVKGSKN